MKYSRARGYGLAVIALLTAATWAQNISVYVDGARVQFTGGVTPRYMGSRVMVPLRGVFEQMGATVNWDAGSRTVFARRGSMNVELPIGSRNAVIDGRTVTLDTPAMIIAGNTMVPLRFLSESLGATVDWNATAQRVDINTGGAMRSEKFSGGNANRTATLVVLKKNTVIPVTLNDELNSDTSKKGERFTATLRTNGSSDYGGLPPGTTVEGVVSIARPQRNDKPGVLGLDFQRIRLPDGRSYEINGALIGLDNQSVTTNSNGVMTALPAKRTDRLTYVGYGAGAGVLVALITRSNVINDAVIGAALGYLYGTLQDNQRNAHSVDLKPGTQFGVRLDKSLSLERM